MSEFEFTEKTVSSLPFATDSSKPSFHRDTLVTGFGVKVGLKTKSFFAEGRIRGKGKTKRVKVGTYPNFTVKVARVEARKIVNSFALGSDHTLIVKQEAIEKTTLRTCFEDYLCDHQNLKPRTVKDYREILKWGLAEIVEKPLKEITGQVGYRLYKKLSKKSHARASNTMRVLRALFNYAKGKYDLDNGQPVITHNPVDKLNSVVPDWNFSKRRRTYIQPKDMKSWYDAVMSLPDTSKYSSAYDARDFFIFSLFTGFRFEEASTLLWANINFADKTITIQDTKNRDDHALPMCPVVEELLQQRFKVENFDDYVFSNTNGQPFGYPNNWIKKVRSISGVYFCPNDLRRTFETVAESLDIRSYALKMLINHRQEISDVTSGYIQITAERLREPVAQISKRLISFCNGEVTNGKS